jgi:RhtB (resistance to homoserine/threonine) family protein
MYYLTLIGTVTFIHLLAVISPGPDFILAVKNSLAYSRRTGIFTAVGFGLGIVVHLLYCAAGLALIISQSIVLFNAFKLIGAGYLMYIGYKSLVAKSSDIQVTSEHKLADISQWEATKMGFFTNAFNPKATLFFLSLFTLVISPETPKEIVALMGSIMVMNTIFWFSLVAVFFTQPKVQKSFNRFQKVFDKILGGLLIALGVKVAVMEK